jgi:hypothetical protein
MKSLTKLAGQIEQNSDAWLRVVIIGTVLE